MSRAVDLPAECWGEILQEAIFVPLFFDTNPLEKYPVSMIRRYNDDAPYWESERTRNTLRRVCSSWNKFLKRFDYRYIQVDHVMSGDIPPEALRQAIRISVDQCACLRCAYLFDFTVPTSDGPTWSELVAAAHDEDTQGAWSVQIMQFDLSYLSYAVEIIKLPSRCKNIKVVFDYQDPGSPMDFIPRLIRPNIISVAETGIPARFWTLDLRNLTALHLRVASLDPLGTLSLPSLQHLSINSIETGFRLMDARPLLRWLNPRGSRLVTFFWAGDASDDHFLSELWDLCPRLRHLQLPRGIQWTPPPPDRSLDLLRLEYLPRTDEESLQAICSMCDRFHRPELFQFTDCIPQLALDSIPSIAISMEWRSLLMQSSVKGGLNAAHCLKLQAASYGITTLDVLGYTFEDTVVSWIDDQISGKDVYSAEWLNF